MFLARPFLIDVDAILCKFNPEALCLELGNSYPSTSNT